MNDFDPLALVKKYLVEKKFEETVYHLIIDKMTGRVAQANSSTGSRSR